MHTPLRVSIDQAEREVKAFAGEFLFPEEAIRRELIRPITLAGLAQTKHRWGASISFQVVHASRTGLITPNQYRYLMQQIAMKGWRKEEKGDSDIVPEKPRAFLKMAEVVYGSPLDLNMIRKQTGLPINLLRSVFAGAAHKTDRGANLQLVKRTERKLA
jgi:Zn-dependent peptidase ImmA (M78 family)